MFHFSGQGLSGVCDAPIRGRSRCTCFHRPVGPEPRPVGNGGGHMATSGSTVSTVKCNADPIFRTRDWPEWGKRCRESASPQAAFPRIRGILPAHGSRFTPLGPASDAGAWPGAPGDPGRGGKARSRRPAPRPATRTCLEPGRSRNPSFGKPQTGRRQSASSRARSSSSRV